ncbi:MAG: S8 family serine peptidase [Bacteroidales bacterium]|nr:S8 family serine peptidase [Bacteroidales bacterium]MCF8350601.1 S8 family serine peptidase [Bacteroidales bacterium]MCF8377166.1 S8 family serine peptidase [Bacteroidales bacterium]
MLRFVLFALVTLLLKPTYPQSVTDSVMLSRLSSEYQQSYQLAKQTALRWAMQNNVPIRGQSGDAYFELQFVEDDIPQYYTTHNADAAISISTDLVYPSGGIGLSLTGSGITLREWDAGGVLETHQEFGNRVTQIDSPGSTHYHATHVAGTMIASGVQSQAKGMAYEADLRAFDWNSDDSEMASEASDGALISNHSYGFIRGWYGGTWYGDPAISTEEDYKFGFYDYYTQQWDQIAYNAPYYLICKSAGNDRNDCGDGSYPCDGAPDGYDCIGQQGIAKNILTIAAVYDVNGGYSGASSVNMTSFSSWGPADDGRIKPDLSANGVSLYSTDNGNNSDYTWLSGTSMSSPSVAGSLALLQEYYDELNGSFMFAATLKAMVVHTADEAGLADGPDYEFGWGLMNTSSAAQLISAGQNTDLINELSLADGNAYNRDVVATGTEPLKATIVWTDPPGTPVPAQLDPPDAMLVNDLDLSISDGSTTYYPWKLDRDNPSDPATNSGENDVDNVEVVYIASPSSGTYTITVDHDGTLRSSPQAFSLIISGIVPDNAYVNGDTITSGSDSCYNATGVLTVSEDSAVVVNNGGGAEFIAGNKIIFKPGFLAETGSNVSGYITETNDFCSNQAALVANSTSDSEPLTAEMPERFADSQSDIIVYPNPGKALFNVILNDVYNRVSISVKNLHGGNVMEQDLTGITEFKLDMSSQPDGIYVLVVRTERGLLTTRLVKSR